MKPKSSLEKKQGNLGDVGKIHATQQFFKVVSMPSGFLNRKYHFYIWSREAGIIQTHETYIQENIKHTAPARP